MKMLRPLLMMIYIIIIALAQIQSNSQNQPRFFLTQQSEHNHSPLNNHQRKLFVTTTSQIRFTIDVSALNTVNTNTTSSVLSFITKIMYVTQHFIKTRIKVTPQTSNILAPSKCIDYTTLQNDRNIGIAASDLHVYVSYITNSNFSYVAQGKYCVQIPISASADTSLSAGRPIMGSIKFNTNSSLRPLDGVTLTNRLFADTTASAIHEMIHILGFDNDLYAAYLNPLTGIKYGIGNVVDATSTNVLSSSKYKPNSKMIVTPNVVSQAKAYFDCPTITGMPLEDEETLTAGTTYSAHWEKSLLYDQLMTVTPFDAQRGISVITYALLQDMGWYTVDTTFNDTMPYGYKRGCDFFYKLCKDSLYNEFCDPTSLNKSCSPQSFSKAVCQVDPYTNGCGIWVSALYCVDPNSQDDGYKTVSQQVYGTNSFCVSSTLGLISILQTQTARCYQYICQSNSIIKFIIGNSTIYCNSSNTNQPLKLSGSYGTLTCPDYNSFCTNSRKVCPNWCSQNGFCTGGICNCNYGYSGADCSIKICNSPTQYYLPLNNTCISNTTTCPSGTYANLYDFTCMPCDISCTLCAFQPKICVSCLGGILVLYQTNCIAKCPNGFYVQASNTLGNICKPCNTNCYNCNGPSANNCVQCKTGLYLDSFTNSCTSDCSSTSAQLYDVIYHRCLSSCDKNLKLKNITYCDICDPGLYKNNNSQCLSDCPSGYFRNNYTIGYSPINNTRFCDKCDTSCQTCSGIQATNCMSCDPTSTKRFLFLNMCVLNSSCPVGTFPDTINNACSICNATNSSLICKSCINSSGAIVCTACTYGYFYYNYKCSTSCPIGTFANKANNTCVACAINCSTCQSPYNNSCLTCLSGFYILTNVTGGYCLNNCPQQYYYSSGSSCISCYVSCLSCNGASISNCTACISNMYLLNGHCYYSCLAGYYQQNSTNTCKPCSQNCTFCFGPTTMNCTKCISGLVLDNTTCGMTCSNGMNQNIWGICQSMREIIRIGLLLILLIILI